MYCTVPYRLQKQCSSERGLQSHQLHYFRSIMPSTSETRKLVSSTRQQSQTISKFFLPKTKQKRQHHDDDEDDDQEVKPLVFTKPSSNRDGETGKGRDKEQLPGTTADNPLSIFDDDDDDDNYDVHNEDSNDEANSGKKEGDDDKLISSPPTKTMPISTSSEKEEEEEKQEEPKSTNNLFAMFAYRAKSSPGSGASSSSSSKKPRTQFNLIQGVQPSTTKAAKSSEGASQDANVKRPFQAIFSCTHINSYESKCNKQEL